MHQVSTGLHALVWYCSQFSVHFTIQDLKKKKQGFTLPNCIYNKKKKNLRSLPVMHKIFLYSSIQYGITKVPVWAVSIRDVGRHTVPPSKEGHTVLKMRELEQ